MSGARGPLTVRQREGIKKVYSRPAPVRREGIKGPFAEAGLVTPRVCLGEAEGFTGLHLGYYTLMIQWVIGM